MTLIMKWNSKFNIKKFAIHLIDFFYILKLVNNLLIKIIVKIIHSF